MCVDKSKELDRHVRKLVMVMHTFPIHVLFITGVEKTNLSKELVNSQFIRVRGHKNPDNDLAVTLSYDKALGFKVEEETRVVLILEYNITLRYDQRLDRVATYKSSVIVRTKEEQEFFRLDYSQEPKTDNMKSHYNIYAYSDAYLKALSSVGVRGDSKNNKAQRFFKEFAKGNTRMLEHFHFPTGEPHFRPSLEEIIYCLADEFGLSYRPNGKKILKAMIATRREQQIESFILDNKDVAAKVLHKVSETSGS